jgi:hypothetical protein
MAADQGEYYAQAKPRHSGIRCPDMSLTSESDLLGQCLRLRVTGSYASRDEIFRVMETLKADADRAGCRQAILDLTAAQGCTSAMDRYFLGERAALIFRAQLKVAVVFPAEGITKFGENVAVNRGAQLAVVPTEQDAIKWLEQTAK